MWLEFEAGKQRAQEDFERMTVQAYQTVLIWAHTQGQKKMPSIDKFLPKGRRGSKTVARKPRSSDTKVMLEVLAARMGGKVRTRVAPEATA